MSAAADERSVAQLLVLKSHHWVCCCFGMEGWRCPAPLCQDHIFLFVSLDSLHSSGRCWSCDSASNRLCVQHPLLWPSHLLKPQLSLRGLYSTIQHNTTQHKQPVTKLPQPQRMFASSPRRSVWTVVQSHSWLLFWLRLGCDVSQRYGSPDSDKLSQTPALNNC